MRRFIDPSRPSEMEHKVQLRSIGKRAQHTKRANKISEEERRGVQGEIIHAE